MAIGKGSKKWVRGLTDQQLAEVAAEGSKLSSYARFEQEERKSQREKFKRERACKGQHNFVVVEYATQRYDKGWQKVNIGNEVECKSCGTRRDVILSCCSNPDVHETIRDGDQYFSSCFNCGEVSTPKIGNKKYPQRKRQKRTVPLLRAMLWGKADNEKLPPGYSAHVQTYCVSISCPTANRHRGLGTNHVGTYDFNDGKNKAIAEAWEHYRASPNYPSEKSEK